MELFNMAKHVMDRKAADNKYLHRDFHTGFDIGVAYIGERYGDNAVKEYLRNFTVYYYSPLIEKAKKQGFDAIADHLRNIYEIEETPEALTIEQTEKELKVGVSACPAVTYFNKTGHTPSKWYVEATATWGEALADALDYGFEMISYEPSTGKAAYRFFKR